MKLLKYLLLLLLIIIVIPLVLALFVDKDYQMKREAVINVSNEKAFDYIKFLKNHDNFNVWAQQDTLLNPTFTGTDGVVGFVYKWDSDNPEVGKGEQEIMAIEEGERIDYQLRFVEPMKSTAEAYMRVDSLADDTSKVEWGFEGHLDYPINVMLLVVNMEDLLGEDLEQGLDNLKEILESQPELPAIGTKAYLRYYHKKVSESLIAEVQYLSNAQFHYKPNNDRWSIAQNLDHIVKSENLLLNIIKKEMEKNAVPMLLDSIGVSDQEILRRLGNRSTRYQAPKELLGTDKYKSVDSAIADYLEVEKAILKYAQQTDLDKMRNHQSVYPFGNSDVYQALLSLAGHTGRHTEQIQQIKADHGYPKL
jgi:uncharacterized damage-inducible protein DinB